MSEAVAETYPGSVDLSNCDREPIHIPGAVQPHGILFAVDAESGRVTHVSENVAASTAGNGAAALGSPLADALSSAGLDPALAVPALAAGEGQPVLIGAATRHGADWDVVAHRRGPSVLVELEPRAAPTDDEARAFYAFVGAGFARLRAAPDVAALSRAAAEEVRSLTGFDRVMIYRFHPDASGEVIAEARDPAMEPFLGLHFPATDIPQQARALYLLNTLRLIADVDYEPAALVAAAPDLAPLDMSFSVLRSVSPIHLQYLKNMGVGASMSISLVQNGALWGLIACHHRTARYVPYPVRTACDLLAQVMASELTATEARAGAAARARAARHADVVCDAVERGASAAAALRETAADLLAFAGATGAALREDDRLLTFGETPGAAQVDALIDWLAATGRGNTWATDALPALFPDAEAYADRASGLLAAAIAPDARQWLVWFRPERVRTVDWAGDPRQPYVVEPGGSATLGARLGPRRSFEQWRETVRGRSAPWESDIPEIAEAMRRTLVSAALRRSQAEVARLNAELSHSNDELEAFTYAAAHDLKEPLRGIRHYAAFVEEDHGASLPDEARDQLAAIGRLSRRMEQMIESLFQYARVGRMDLARDPLDLNELLPEVRELLAVRLAEAGADLRVPRPLPTVRGDRVRVTEVFYNLIANAAKYNDRPPGERVIEVGFADGTALPILYVRDNGIGIPEAQRANVFRLFRRLHTRDAYGGGTGTGLAIVRRVVERHGGRLWFESAPGEGTTFFFTLEGEGEEG